MADGTNFSDYVNAVRNARNVGRTTGSSGSGEIVKFGAGKGGFDPLGFVVDILSRPEYAVTETMQSGLEWQDAANKAAREGKNYDALGEALKTFTAPVRGLFSTNEADKPLSSDLMELQADVQGRAADPNYVDVKDNVDPVLKGVGGFGGDIALDPLTYIPVGGWIAKGIREAAMGTKAAIKGAEAVAESAKTAEKVGAKATTDAAAATSREAAQATAEGVGKGVVSPEMANTATDLMEAVPTTTAKGAKAAAAETVATPSVYEQMVASPKYKAAKAELKRLVAPIKEDYVPAAPKPTGVAATAPAQLKTLKELSNDYLNKVAEGAPEVMVKLPSGKSITLSNAIAATGAEAKAAARNYFTKHAELYRASGGRVDSMNRLVYTDKMSPMEFVSYKAIEDPKFVVAKTGSRYLTAPQVLAMAKDSRVKPEALASIYRQVQENMGDELAALVERQTTRPAAKAAAKAPDANPFSARFLSRMESSEAAKISKILGKELSSALMRRQSSFETSVNQLLKLMDGQRALDNVIDNKAMSTIDRAMMKMLDIDVAGTNLARRENVSHMGTARGKAISDAYNEGLTAERIIELGGFTSQEAKDLTKFFDKFIAKFPDIGGYKYRSKTEVARTHKTPGKGKGKREKEFNTYDFWTLLKDVTKRASAMADSGNNPLGRKMSGAERSEFVKQYSMRSMAIAEAILDQMGVPLWMGVGKAKRVQLSLTQAFAVLNEINPEIVSTALFNAGTRAVTTNILEAVAAAVRGASRKELDSLLLTTVTGQSNAFVTGGKYGFANGKVKTIDAATLRRRFLDTLEQATPALQEITIKNATDYLRRFRGQAKDLEADFITRLVNFANTPGKMDSAIYMVDDIANQIAKTADENWMLDLSKIAAQIGVKTKLPFGLEVSAKVAKNTRSAAAKASKETPPKASPKEQAKRTQAKAQEPMAEQAKQSEKLSDEAYTKGDPEAKTARPEEAMASKAHGSIMDDVFRRMDPLRKAFSRHYGMEHVSNLIHSVGNGYRELRGNFVGQLNDLNKMASQMGSLDSFGQPRVRQVWRDIQNNVASSPENTALRAKMEEVASKILDVKGKAALNDLTNIGGIGPDVFLRYLKGVKIHEVIGRDADNIFNLEEIAKKAKKEYNNDLWAAMADEWRNMDVVDPIDFMGRWHAALTLANTDGSLTHGFLNEVRKIPDGISAAKREGYVDISDLGGPLSPFVGDTIYVRKDLADEFVNMGEYVREARRIGGAFGNFLNKYFFPMQDTWKFAITLPRPGHHLRNAIGDMSMTFMAEGIRYATESYRDAWRVLGFKGSYKDVDLLAALRNEGIREFPKGNDIISRGLYGNLTIAQLFDWAQKKGLMPVYHVSEDFGENITQSNLKKILDVATVRGGKVEGVLGGFSEARDHYARMQHFLQFIYRAQNPTKWELMTGQVKKYSTLEEMIDAASKKVKKYHPDGSMLTPFEAKYLRTVIPFYSWFRGALPAIIESAMIHPGRAMVYPKASYNMAIAMGVDPNSLSDPFPTDQMFPSFLTEQVTGPVAKINGNYLSIAPGIANIDVANQFGTDPWHALLGMTSPLLRVPIELSTGSKLATGSRIKDASDYIDSNIPGINYLSNMTGTSITGTLFGGAGIDPQADFKAGNKTDGDKMISFINWMTGVGLQNVSKPNFINLAEIEKRNREGDNKSAF